MAPVDGSRLRRALALFLERPGGAVSRVLALLRASLVLRRCEHGARTTLYGRVRVEPRGAVRIGAGVTFSRGPVASELLCAPGAILEIGDDCVFNYGVSLDARASIRIGRRCMFASYVRVCDGGRDGAAAIDVGDDVWIAHGAIIGRGVSIGAGSVVAAGAVVTHDVPEAHVAAGNPARNLPLSLATGDATAASPPPGARRFSP